MPTKKSEFTSKSLDAQGDKKATPKKRVRKKVVKKKVVKTVKKPTKKTIANNEIERQLSDIYKDNTGHMPNMKKIQVKKGHPIIKFFFSLLIVAGLLAAITWAGFFVLPNNKKFSEDKVTLTINGPKEIQLGATSTYIISYANNQNTKLNNAILTIQYPKGFTFVSSDSKANNTGNTEWSLGSIQPNEKKNITIVGLTYGEINNEESWRAFLTYKPDKFNYEAQKVSTLTVGLKQSPFELSLSGPDKAISGNDVEYIFKVENKKGVSINNLKLIPAWSENFYISTSSPKLEKDNSWKLDNSTTTVLTFKLKGKFTSSTAKKVTVSSKLVVVLPNGTEQYQIASNKLDTTLEENNLKLDLAINGNIKDFNSQPGDNLSFSVYLKNNSQEDMKEVSVDLEIETPSANQKSVMDWENLVDKYDGNVVGTQISPTVRTGEIKWDKKFIPKLTNMIPNDTISIDITLPTRGIDKFDLTTLKNYEIKVVANVSYQTKAGSTKLLSSNPIKITLNSDLKLEIRDTKTTNSSQKEEHKIKWILTNNFHELTDITLSADIYGKVDFKLDSEAPAGTATYDSSTQKLTWKISKLPLALDTYALPFTITINEKNSTQKTLVTKVTLEATDSVTKETIKLEGKEIQL